MHYIRLVVLGDSQVGKTSLIRQLVGEELKSEPELKCEADIEAYQRQIEATWLSVLGEHESEQKRAIETRRLASLLESQIELQQLLLKQQQGGSRQISTKTSTTKSSTNSTDSRRKESRPQVSQPDRFDGSLGDVGGKKRFEEAKNLIAAGAKSVSDSRKQEQLDNKPCFKFQAEKGAKTRKSHQNDFRPDKSHDKALSSRTSKPSSSRSPSPSLSSSASSSSSTSPTSSTLRTARQKRRSRQHVESGSQLERPTILISSSSLTNSATNLDEQVVESRRCASKGSSPAREANVELSGSDPEHARNVRRRGVVASTAATKKSAAGERLIENTCTSIYNERLLSERATDSSQRRTKSSSSATHGQPQSDENQSSVINQPLRSNRAGCNDELSCASRSENAGAGSEPNGTSTEHANHVPSGGRQSQQTEKEGSRSRAACRPSGAQDSSQFENDKKPARQPPATSTSDCETFSASAPLRTEADPKTALNAPDMATTAGTESNLANQQHDFQQRQALQLKQMRSLDASRKVAAATSSENIDNNDRKDSSVALCQPIKSSSPLSQQHRHSYCAPTSAVSDMADQTTSGAGGQSSVHKSSSTSSHQASVAAARDELSTQAKIINILFSNNKTSGPTNQEPRGGGNKPLLMPALLRQYQRRLSNFHSHGANQQQQQQQTSAGSNQQTASGQQRQQKPIKARVIDGKSATAETMSKLIAEEHSRRAKLTQEAALAAASLARSAAAAAQALLATRSTIVYNQTTSTTTTTTAPTMAEAGHRPIESGQHPEIEAGYNAAICNDEVRGDNGTVDADHDDVDRSEALCRFPLAISGSCHPTCWIRGGHALDEHSICHEASLYALTEKYRLKLIAPSQQSRALRNASSKRGNEWAQARISSARADLALDCKYDIRHFCSNYIDNMNLYEIKIVDMPTIEPINEFPTSSLLEWSLFKGRSHLLTADAYLLVFDLTRPSTIQYIKMLRDKIFESREMSNVPVYVIANKADLCPTLQPSLQARQMRNVAVRRHQAALSQPTGDLSTNTQVSTSGQQEKAGQQNSAGHATEPKWRLFSRRDNAPRIGPQLQAPLGPAATSFKLPGEQRSMPAAAAHQLLAAYKMHRMRLGGTGPIVSLRRWARLRRAVALHEPKSFGAGLAGFAGGAANGGTGVGVAGNYMGGASQSAWSQFERKRMHYSLIVGASSGLDSRLPGGSSSSRMGRALGRVRSCLRGSLRIFRRSSANRDSLTLSRSKSRARSSYMSASFQRTSASRRQYRRRQRRRRRRSERDRDRTELAFIEKAKRRKSSLFMGPFTSWHPRDTITEKSSKDKKSAKRQSKHKSKKKESLAKVTPQQVKEASVKRLSWSRWLHLSAPSELPGAEHSSGQAGRDQSETSSQRAVRPSASRMSDLMSATWRISGERIGFKQKRTSESVSLTSSIPNSKSTGILKQSRASQQTQALKKTSIQYQSTGSLTVTSFDRSRAASDQSRNVSQQGPQTEMTLEQTSLATKQPDAHKVQANVVNERPRAEPICGAMSTPTSRQTFYDLFNKLLQTSSTTAAKTQLKMGAIEADGRHAEGEHQSESANTTSFDTFEGSKQMTLATGQEKQAQATEKKTKRRKSSSTGAALWQTLSSLALSRISQSADRKGSHDAKNGDGIGSHRSSSALGRLSIASRMSGGSGATILENGDEKADDTSNPSNRRAQTQMNDALACEGLRLGTDQYLSVDMLRKLSLISSHSQLSAGEDVPNEQAEQIGNPNSSQNDESKRPKSAPSEPASVASALRRASRALNLGNKHRKQHEEQDQQIDEMSDGAKLESPRPHTGDPSEPAAVGARRFWYRGVVKKILFHSNKQSLKGIVTAIELQKKAEAEASCSVDKDESCESKADEEGQRPVIDIKTHLEPDQPNNDDKVDTQDKDTQQMPRRQSLTVVQSAPSIRIISSGSSLSLISENNNSGGSTNAANHKPAATSSIPATDQQTKSDEVDCKQANLNTQQEASLSSMTKQTMSASSSATSLASSSASLSESITLNIDTDNKKASLGAHRSVLNAGSGDSLEAVEEDDNGTLKASDANRGKETGSGVSNSDSDECSTQGLSEPQLTYQLRKLSADDCLIINRHRRQSLAAMQNNEAMESLRKRTCDSLASGKQEAAADDAKGELDEQKQQTQRQSDESTSEQGAIKGERQEGRAPTGEEGRRQSIKQSIEAAIHLLVPRAKARSASITLGATDCERRSRSQLGTTIMGAVNVHKTWRDWRQLLGRKKGAASEIAKRAALDGLANALNSDKNMPDSSATRFSGNNLGLSNVASPPIVGFLSSHVAYKKLSADQQREAAINFDQLMRINQLTLTAANVVMLAASQPPVKPFVAHGTSPTCTNLPTEQQSNANRHQHAKKNLDLVKTLNRDDRFSGTRTQKAVGESESEQSGPSKSREKSGRPRKEKRRHQQESHADGMPPEPLMSRLQTSGHLLGRKSSLSSKAAHRLRKKTSENYSGETSNKTSTNLFEPLLPLGADTGDELVRARSAAADAPLGAGAGMGVSSLTTTAAVTAAAAVAASSQTSVIPEADTSAQIAAAAAGALERQRRRGEKISSILEPRYDKKQPGAEYPIFVSHDLNPILKDLAQLVRKHWKCNYIECSAASNWNIRPIISELTRALECNNRLSSSSSGISVGGDESERSTRLTTEQQCGTEGPGGGYHADESGQSDDVWSSGDDYDLDDSSSTSSDESSCDFISSDNSDDDEIHDRSGKPKVGNVKAEEIVLRPERSTQRGAADTSGAASKCAIM